MSKTFYIEDVNTCQWVRDLSTRTRLDVYVNDLKKIDLHGYSTLNMEKPIRLHDVEINHISSADQSWKIQANEVVLNHSGVGDVEIEGDPSPEAVGREVPLAREPGDRPLALEPIRGGGRLRARGRHAGREKQNGKQKDRWEGSVHGATAWGVSAPSRAVIADSWSRSQMRRVG